METETAQFKHCDLVSARGRIDSYTAPQLANTFDQILAARRYKIVFDMSGVDYMSSAGLRVLTSVQKSCRRYNRGEIILACVPERIWSALELAGFAPLFKVFNSVTVAVGQF